MQITRTIFCAVALLLAGTTVAAQVGHVKTVTGEASVTSGDRQTPARPGTPLHLGDVIRTGSTGALGVTLMDNTMLSFGPSTTFQLEEFLFAPAKGDLLLGGSITAGSLHYVSGAIARLKPDAVRIKTPSGIIGVRGTRFAAVVKEQP
ncbi:FecR domain-containing protein [Pseudorhodoferax sp. Leaf267]|uniref:FecR family protein n=1 Tax=Pseudorhodoferax sp. Leaf267 TaxID=1736316 RepID=UPI0006FDA38A|nr:FecR domain-containing protein [Pseudorhodoferax sp. Leaf267]KQP13545.1 hypothetical protein ASF43_16630 [Pseudorhodoferax sp. Leaf267]